LSNRNDAVQIEGRPLHIVAVGLCGDYEHRTVYGATYVGAPGFGDPEERLREQDVDGIDAEVLFSSLGGGNFCREVRNDDAYRAIVHADKVSGERPASCDGEALR
jgi:hypothetical protein